MGNGRARRDLGHCGCSAHHAGNSTYRELLNLGDDELARRFDLLLSVGSHELTIDHYRDEIQRREIAKQNQRLEWLTGAIFLLTFVLVALEVLPRISGAGY